MQKNSRRLQIGVMGSAADQNYPQELEGPAAELGTCIAKAGHTLVYGANKDTDTLPTVAARAARTAGGSTLGVTYGTERGVLFPEAADVLVASGANRGGGREFVLVNSCDVIILIAGGAGTLTETAIAYQLGLPIVALVRTGGWAAKLAGEYLDARKRTKIIGAETPEEAVRIAIEAVKLSGQ